MPGGWTMSMAWMRMPGQSWAGAAASFMGMWIVMMVAMMMPSLLAMLSSYRGAVRSGGANLESLTALVALGYFVVWTLVGAAVYPLGVAVAAAEMRWPALARSVPIATGIVIVIAGWIQLTAWKRRHLECCRTAPACWGEVAADAPSAWRHGLRLGVHCSLCCSGLITVLLVGGVMDLGMMAVVATAITLERLLPWPVRAARIAGFLATAAGILIVIGIVPSF